MQPISRSIVFQPVGSSSVGPSSALASMVTWTLAFSLRARGRSGLSTPSSYTASTSIVMADLRRYCTVLPRQGAPFTRKDGWMTSGAPLTQRGEPHSLTLTAAPLLMARSYATAAARSEEHTSELQSHVNLVCRLLLEK